MKGFASSLLTLFALLAITVNSAIAAPPITRGEHKCIKKVIDDYIQTHLEIYFIYDGCCSRALTLHAEIKKVCGDAAAQKVEQLFLLGRLCPKKKVMWGFHTSLCVTMGDGKRYVLDPALADDPIPYDKWVEMCRGTEGNSDRCILQACDGTYPSCLDDKDPEADQLREKKADCHYRCYGALINGYLQGDTIQNQTQREEFRNNTMADCKECETRCKEQGLDAPFLNGKSGETTSCEWAAQFEGTSREIPRFDPDTWNTSCVDPSTVQDWSYVSVENESPDDPQACTVSAEFLESSLFNNAAIRLLSTIDEDPENPYPVEMRDISATPRPGECGAMTQLGMYFFTGTEGGVCAREPFKVAAPTPSPNPTTVPVSFTAAPITQTNAPTPAPSITSAPATAASPVGTARATPRTTPSGAATPPRY